jgi:predicted Zn finger-like uncharacterized protein
MPSSNPDDKLLLIRCPSCGQRFKVGDDLRGRTVECGGCEHRFRIADEVIVRGKKFYPGERKDPGLNRFARVPLAMSDPTSAMPGMRYAEAPDPVNFEPTPPQRIVAGISGVAGMVIMALLLMFGAHRGGILDGMTTGNRLVMAGFTGLLGLGLLVYANPRARLKALLAGLLMSAGLVALPFFFTSGSVPLSALEREVGMETGDSGAGAATDGEPEESDEMKALRERIGTDPLEAEIERLAKEGSTKRSVGIWLRDLRERNRFTVRDYIQRMTGSEPPPHFFPRDGGNFLVIVYGINQSLEEVAKIASAFGTVEKSHPEISVIEVLVNNESFVEGPIEKLNDRSSPAFYDLNKRELESIDLERVSKAVKRLASAEPKIYRSDINRKLLQLLAADWVDFKPDVCEALEVWAESPGPAGEAALAVAKELLARERAVPKEVISLIVKENNPAVIPILDELWSKNPVAWESLYGDVGEAAEATLIRRMPDADGALRQSLVRLLGQVGGADSLPLLEDALAGADAELKVLIEKASAAIRKRISR